MLLVLGSWFFVDVAAAFVVTAVGVAAVAAVAVTAVTAVLWLLLRMFFF